MRSQELQKKGNPYTTLYICQVSFAAAQIMFVFLTWPPDPQSSSVLPVAFPQWTFQGHQKKIKVAVHIVSHGFSVTGPTWL